MRNRKMVITGSSHTVKTVFVSRIFLSLLLALMLAASPAVFPAASADAAAPLPTGYRFAFGRFEQNTFGGDGPDPIIWRVLDTDEATGNVLVLSEYGLITMKYNRKNKMTKWGESDVRNWLNGDFLSSFTEEERQQIVTTTVSGSEDTVFMLNAEEIRKYLSEPYLCYATLWAKKHNEKGAYVNKETGGSSWLVRMDSTDKLINIVGGAGGLHIPAEGSKVRNDMTTADNVVRPAMWVKREAIGRETGIYNFSLYARAKMEIATRSGPTTGYNGLGNYNIKGDLVRVVSRVFDGSIWWLQIEFDYKGAIVRCYTGLKRVDIPIEKVPDEATSPIGTGTVIRAADAYYGPGTYYKKQVDKYIPEVGTSGDIYARENGWIFLEYETAECLVRVWLPEDAVAVDGEEAEPELTAEPAEAEETVSEGWTCPACGQEGNAGNYCFNCGTLKPADDSSSEWKCPSCGHEGNTGNYCPACGTQRATGNE